MSGGGTRRRPRIRDGARLVGQMLDVKITLAYPHSLRGEVVVG